jgi:predicted AAA+ superfamily ATPase
MSLWRYVSIREDVFDRSMDENVAPALSDVVLGRAHELYKNPELFISITHVTETIRRIVDEVLNAFASGTGKAIILPSTFGGGKTHIMILLYHLVNNPALLTSILGEEAKSRQSVLGDVQVVVIDGMDKRLAPSPVEPLEENGLQIKTLWGYLAYKLGAYDKVKIHEENLMSPEKSTLTEIFEGKKVLLLIDEIGIYYNRLHSSASQVLTNYSNQVVVFLRVLSEIVRNKNVVLILSIPAEPRERGLEAETGYEDFIDKIEKEVGRSALIVGKPITTDEDFVGILRKRLFSRIDPAGIQLAKNKLRSIHVDYLNHIKDVSGEVEKYYPFHPLFILALREIVEKNKDLQKTRDALKIARKVLRNLYMTSKTKDLMLIMPSDMDLREEEIRVKIITHRYIGFDLVIHKIIKKIDEIPVEEGINKEVFRDLAYRLAIYVFLRTYIYDPYLEPRSEYPSKVEVVTGIYDPERYEQFLISPIIASELLDRLASGSVDYRIPHLYSRDGYYWVTRLLDIGEQIEKEAEKVEDLQAKKLIIEEINELYTKPYERDQEAKPTTLDDKPEVLLDLKLSEEDVSRYKLYIIVPPLDNIKEECITHGDIYELIYYRQSGNQKTMRRYSNTIALLLSNDKTAWERIIKLAKKMEACNRLQKRISEEYKKDEKIARILREELKKFKDDFEKSLKYNLVAQYFNFIAYPTRKDGTKRVCVEFIKTRAQKTIVELAEDALREAGKIVEKKNLTFDLLVSILSETLEKEIKWTREEKVGDLINAFFENPAYPMILPSDIKKMLLSGLENLKIGVMREGKVYFKKVKNDPRIPEIKELRDTDVIIPPEKAAEEQIKELSNIEELVEGDTIIRRYYVAIFGEKEIPIKDIKNAYPGEYVKVFINSEIELREEKYKRGFILNIEPSFFELKQDEAPEKLDVKVNIRRLGDYNEVITLKPDVGEVTPARGVPDFAAVWVLPVPREPGEYTYVIHAEGRELKREANLKIIVKKGLLCKAEPSDKIVVLTIENDIEAIALASFLDAVNTSIQGAKVINKCELRTVFYDEKARELEKLINVSLENVAISDFVAVVKALSSAFGLTAKIICRGGFKLEIRGDGRVVNIENIKKLHDDIKKRNIEVKYCW